ncbi:salviol synthase-like [Prosopis cineraria]|uniref:salviol synthase-like n=1 Tax=Prosopis cineraria TaxID=364024 RepID=UPI00240F5C0A|nr:salviol synthase-like [Prosopis cineraria]
MAELMENPKVMEKAKAEVRKIYKEKRFVDESEIYQLKYLNSIVRETLRLHLPGVLLLPQENIEKCVINGYEIPEKIKVIVNDWAILRDPKFWDDADTFKPQRFLDNLINLKEQTLIIYHLLPNGITHVEFDMFETFAASVRRIEKL